jgi:hypothetical protein
MTRFVTILLLDDYCKLVECDVRYKFMYVC